MKVVVLPLVKNQLMSSHCLMMVMVFYRYRLYEVLEYIHIDMKRIIHRQVQVDGGNGDNGNGDNGDNGRLLPLSLQFVLSSLILSDFSIT